MTEAMCVRKRSGVLEAVDLNKIVRAVSRHCGGLTHVDPMRVATKTVSGLFDGATTAQLDALSIKTASELVVEEPEYSQLAARMMSTYIRKEVGVTKTFSQGLFDLFSVGHINVRTLQMVRDHHERLDAAIKPERDELFEYFGIRTLYDRYLLKHPETRLKMETPQACFMRVAVGLAENIEQAIDAYEMLSTFRYLPGSPTLFNSGTLREQMSSCYILDAPEDSLDGIYKLATDIAKLSKWAGGIGAAFHRVRSNGSMIRGTNGPSNGVVPFLKMLDSSVAAVNQGSRRKGAACFYLETWHADIEDFLECRNNTGDEGRRTHNLNLANWIPDLFMKRVDIDAQWTLFDPKDVPNLCDLFGEEFERAYEKAEAQGLGKRTMPARDLYARMMRTLAETGNGWMTWKDQCNVKGNQTESGSRIIHSSNLCCEIAEINDNNNVSVCNLASVNLARHVTNGVFDFEKLRQTVRVAVRQLDRVIDRNFYPVPEAQKSNSTWRPVGLGVMGLQDVFFQLKLSYEDAAARELSTRIAEEIYYEALSVSCDLAEKLGAHANFNVTKMAQGKFQFDLWGVQPKDMARWNVLRERIRVHGLRNSLLIAIAPTATIGSLSGAYECVEPQVSNLFKRETLSGDFLQMNKYLVEDLRALGLWTEETRAKLKQDEGSVQSMAGVPEGLKRVYRTAWELPMRALIDMAADRGPYIDQSQSINLFVESPTIGRLSSMYMHAWKRGLKTTYYLRSRPATKIAKTTVPVAEAPKKVYTDEEAIVCSLENPEACEACQ